MRAVRLQTCLVALVFLGIGCTEQRQPGDDAGPPDAGLSDSDGDLIADRDEGYSSRRDTDGDGTPDYLDDDSDGDGISDRDEAGDIDAGTQPIDSDGDGMPNFVDTDSDDNGLTDDREGAGDNDGDGEADYVDIDDDNDFARDRDELGGVIEPLADSDGDGIPNYHDPDSDGDGIMDGDEIGPDTDRDGLLDWEDLDSDDDGIEDRDEAGDEDIRSPPVDSDADLIPDFRDPDSDNDGLSDLLEHDNGTNPTLADSDGDGVTDLIEVAAETDPNDGTVSPRTRGDFVFVVPFEEAPMPDRDTLEFRTNIQFADIYFLFDASGSMSGAQDGLAASVGTIMDDLTCDDTGISCSRDSGCSRGQICSSFTGTCIQDPASSSCLLSPWTGAGQYGQAAGSGNLLINRIGVQPDPAMTRSAIDLIPVDGGTEPLYAATWAVVDPMGSPMPSMGCVTPMPGRFGCPGYRDDAVRILVAFTDENTDITVPVGSAAAALSDADVTFIGVWTGGAGTARMGVVDLAQMSGSVSGAGMPLVFDASSSGTGIDMVVANAIREIVEGVPLRATIEATDEPGDAGDALQFIQRLEVNTGGGRCSAIGATEDTDGDGYDDAFPAILPGTPVCWDVVAAENTTVEPTLEPLVFRARITVRGDGSPLDARIVYFLIPPTIELPGGPG